MAKNMPLDGRGTLSSADVISQFRQFICSLGLGETEIVADGKIHRFATSQDKRGQKSGVYVLHIDDYPAGWVKDWRSGEDGKWKASRPAPMTNDERRLVEKRIKAARIAADRQRAGEQEQASQRVKMAWNTAAPNVDNHPYVKKKGIKPVRARAMQDGRLIVPVWDSQGKMSSAQYIAADGGKLFESGGKTGGCYASVSTGQKPSEEMPLIICEGWATACTLHEATGMPVVAALSAHNVEKVASAMRTKYGAEQNIIVCAEDDWKNAKENVGLNTARAAALLHRARFAVPEFGPERGPKDTDFNDMAAAHGLEEVARVVNASGFVQSDEPQESPQAPPDETVPIEAYDEVDHGAHPSMPIDPFDGPMETLFRLSIKRQHRPQPLLTIAAALAGMSACMHGKYALPDGLRGNLYTIGIAGSTAGKSGPLTLVKAMVELSGGMAHSNIGSGQGVEDAMKRESDRRAALVIDEVAHLIGAVADANAPSHMQHVSKMLLDFYSASAYTYTTRLLADESKKPVRMYHPYMTLFGVTTAAKLAATPASMIEDGTLGRCLVMRGEDFVRQIDVIETGSLYAELNEAIGKQLREGSEFGPVISYPGEFTTTVNISPAGKELIRKMQSDFDDEAEAAEAARRVLCGRAVEQIKRIALVLATWDLWFGRSNWVDVRHLEWARDYVRHSHRCLLAFVDSMTNDPIVATAAKVESIMRDAISGNETFEAKYKRYGIIAKQEGKVAKTAILKKMNVKSKILAEVLQHMTEAGVIEPCTIDTGAARGRQTIQAYRLI